MCWGWWVWDGGGGGGVCARVFGGGGVGCNAISGPFDSIAFHVKHVFHSASFSSAEARLCDSHLYSGTLIPSDEGAPAHMLSHEYTRRHHWSKYPSI